MYLWNNVYGITKDNIVNGVAMIIHKPNTVNPYLSASIMNAITVESIASNALYLIIVIGSIVVHSLLR